MLRICWQGWVKLLVLRQRNKYEDMGSLPGSEGENFFCSALIGWVHCMFGFWNPGGLWCWFLNLWYRAFFQWWRCRQLSRLWLKPFCQLFQSNPIVGQLSWMCSSGRANRLLDTTVNLSSHALYIGISPPTLEGGRLLLRLVWTADWFATVFIYSMRKEVSEEFHCSYFILWKRRMVLSLLINGRGNKLDDQSSQGQLEGEKSAYGGVIDQVSGEFMSS